MRPTNAAVLSSLLLFASSTGAAEPETVRLGYEVAAGCPALSRFVAEVRARTGKVRFSTAEPGRAFRVTVESSADGYVGMLRISDPEGLPSERRFDGVSCDEVVSSLALVAALAVDPGASTAAPAPPMPRVEPTAPARVEAQRDRPTRLPAGPHRAGTPATRLRADVGPNAAVIRGPAPEPLLAAGAHLGLSRTGAPWTPAVRWSAFVAQTGVVGPSAARGRFLLAAARTAISPVVLRPSRAFEVAPSAVVDLGVIHARGTEIADPGSATRPWVALGLDLWATYDVTERVYVGASAGGAVHLTRDRFHFTRPDVTVHEVPAFAATTTFFGGAHF